MLNDLIIDINKRESERLATQGKQYRKTTNWASSIGECKREMFYSITEWDKKPVPDLHLLARFEEGREQERKILRRLLENGLDVIEGQKPIDIKDRKGRVVISARLEGKVRWNGSKIPFEIKSLNPNVYARIDTVEDFNKMEWSRRYPIQMNLYLYAENAEQGLFILTDCLGHFKLIPCFLDLDLVERVLTVCTEVMDAVESGNPPDFLRHKPNTCKKCWAFGRVCQPPIEPQQGLELIDNSELLDALIRREQTEEAHHDYAVADKIIKDILKGKPMVICGDYQITGEEKNVHYKEQPAKPAFDQKRWSMKIERL